MAQACPGKAVRLFSPGSLAGSSAKESRELEPGRLTPDLVKTFAGLPCQPESDRRRVAGSAAERNHRSLSRRVSAPHQAGGLCGRAPGTTGAPGRMRSTGLSPATRSGSGYLSNKSPTIDRPLRGAQEGATRLTAARWKMRNLQLMPAAEHCAAAGNAAGGPGPLAETTPLQALGGVHRFAIMPASATCASGHRYQQIRSPLPADDASARPWIQGCAAWRDLIHHVGGGRVTARGSVPCRLRHALWWHAVRCESGGPVRLLPQL